MARWKAAGQMAVAIREAERQAEERRIRREQYQESIRNGKILRSLQRGREKFYRDSRIALTRPEHQFKTTQAENVDKLWDAHVATSQYYQRQDTHDKGLVMVKIKTMDNDLKEIEKIKSAIDVIQIKEREADRQIQALRQTLRDYQVQEKSGRVETAINRVELAHQQYGQQLAQNRQLVAHIAHLQGERDKVKRIHSQLQHDLDELSRELGVHVGEAQSTYEQRDMNERNMAKLQDHMQKTTASFVGDMQLLQFKIDVLKRMEHFMITKIRFRPDEGKERRQRLRNQLSTTEKDHLMFTEIMSKIKTDLQDEDLHDVVRTFIEMEQENYMLFNNVSYTRDLCHNMQVVIQELKQKSRRQLDDETRKERETFMRKVEMEEKVSICRKEAERVEQQVADADEIIATFINNVLDILHKLGYTPEDIERLAGVYKCVEERNIRIFLAEIERHINMLYDLKTARDYRIWLKAHRMSMSMTSQIAEPLPPRHPQSRRVVVVPPQLDTTDDMDDSVLPAEATFRPLSWEEIHRYVLQDLLTRSDTINEFELREKTPSANKRREFAQCKDFSPSSSSDPARCLSEDVF